MQEDLELLRTFADTRSETAFAELVRRHVNLVYSVATRQVGGDLNLAQDVTQEVFTALATKAGRLLDHRSLASWLYVTTQFSAGTMVRKERQRRAREHEVAMNIDTTVGEHIDWDRARPLLDQAIADLPDADRDGVCLRFFENRAFAEIGGRLGVSENASRMRIDRALEKLQRNLERRGITSTSAAVAIAMAGQSAVAVPTGLVATVAHSALAGAAGGGAAAIIFATMNKLNVGIIGGLVLLGSAAVYLQQRSNAALRQEAAHLRELVQAATRAPASKTTQAATAGSPQASSQAAVPTPSRAETRASREPAPVGAAAIRAGMLPKESWANVGQATPAAAYQTAVWAGKSGDFDALTQVLAIQEPDRHEGERLFASLPENIQTQYGNPERLIAMIFTSGPTDDGFAILSETHKDPTTVEQQVLISFPEDGGTGYYITRLTCQLGPTGWRILAPSSMVAGAIRKVTGKQADSDH